MAERQALGIDIDNNARTGGTNFDLVKEHIQAGVYDFLIIKAGFGLFRSPIFEEQREQAEREGIPFVTYHFPDPRVGDMKKQAKRYIDRVGTEQPVYIIDAEAPKAGSRPPNKEELRTVLGEVEKLTKKQPVLYTRVTILEDIGFVNGAREFRLWIAQWPWDPALSDFVNDIKVKYHFFHDFTRDFTGKLPSEVLKNEKVEVLKDKVIMWQFTDHGAGPHYIYNKRTKDPKFPGGKLGADLNISITGRKEFMQMMFGGVPVISRRDEEEEQEEEKVEGGRRASIRLAEPTYPGLTNQGMINLIFTAAEPFTDEPWADWVVRAKLTNLAIPTENRRKPYTGPKIEDLPNLTKEEKAAILAAKKAEDGEGGPGRGTYPGMNNQEMINLIFAAAAPFTDDPWTDWIVHAELESLAIPTENRRKPYTGPKVEDLPNLTESEKAVILAEMKET